MKLLSAILMATVATSVVSTSGCDLPDYYAASPTRSTYGDDTDPNEDQLIVDGSGEVIELKWNDLTFPARVNWQDGRYYFSPDPEGTMTGHRTVCVVSMDERNLEGRCFRQQHVCNFAYDRDSYNDEDIGENIYYPRYNNCRRAGDMGPFLVPLNNPLCGEDPYPACPAENLFPSNIPTPTTPDTETPTVVSGSFVEDFQSALCAAAARCDPTYQESRCVSDLGGNDLSTLWNQLGAPTDRSWTSAHAVEEALLDGSLHLDEAQYEFCRHEVIEICDSQGEYVAVNGVATLTAFVSHTNTNYCLSVLSR